MATPRLETVKQGIDFLFCWSNGNIDRYLARIRVSLVHIHHHPTTEDVNVLTIYAMGEAGL